MLEFIVVVIILSSILGSFTGKNTKTSSDARRSYDGANRKVAYTKSDNVEDTWNQLKQRIEEAAGLNKSPQRHTNSQRAAGRNQSTEIRKRGGVSPKHRKITADISRPTDNHLFDRGSQSSTLARKAEIAESIAYWEANRAHMQSINDDLNQFIDYQHAEMRNGMRQFKVNHNR